MNRYREYKQLDLPEIAKEELKRWEEEHTFEQSVSSREGSPSFTFYEGPPSANGLPGIHHVMARAIKDIFCRYKTLKGFQVKRKGGWDTHGLPIEISVEKTLGIKKEDIGKTISVEAYNKECRKEVMRYKDVWDELTRRMGYWVDLKHPYITFKNEYIETCWYLLQQFYKKDLLYKGYTIQPYSPAAGTGLSSHELNQPGTYRDIKDTSAVAQFKIADVRFKIGDYLNPEFAGKELKNDVFFLAWTTTPWTLPANAALAVGEKIIYVFVKTFNAYTHKAITVVLAKDLLGKYFKTPPPPEGGSLQPDEMLAAYKPGDKYIPYQIIGEITGKELKGVRYEQLLPYVQLSPSLGGVGEVLSVIIGDFVTTENGTGIVHIAPSFGADDFRVAKQNGIEAILVKDENGNDVPIVDKQGRFVKEITDFAGEYVKEQYLTDKEKEAEHKKQGGEKYLSVDERIGIKLKKENKAFKVEKYEHSYPHCWRTDKPILYYPLDSWFIKTTAKKDRLIELNKTINWKPESTGTGRFGNWLENLVDWNLSRSRFWGIPLPIWRTTPPQPSPKGREGNQSPSQLSSEKAESNQPYKAEEICIGSIDELKKEIEKSIAAGFMDKSHLEHIDVAKPDFDLHRPYVDNIILVSDSGKKMTRETDLIDVWFDSGAMPYAQWHFPFERPTPDPSLREGKPRYVTADPVVYNLIREHQLKHRDNPTQAEEALWQYLKGDKTGVHFRRQHIIGDFIVDFVCLSKKLIVEVDGKYHNSPDMVEADKLRTEILESQGYKVIRFTNEEVTGDIDAVLFNIKKELAHRAALPLGEGLGGVFPADFIAEGVDQTRGWFFTLHAIAGMLFDSVAFKNVVSNGLVLDKNGNKMSKRLGNAADPFETIDKYGADATRWYMISNAQPWDNLKFNFDGITEAQRKFFGTLYNTYSFFSLYANIDGFAFKEAEIPVKDRPEIDRWVLSELNSLIRFVDECYADYEPTKASRAIQDFVTEHLSNWYVRLCRRRFWKGDYTQDKIAAYQTLYTCLEVVAQLMSPVAPFYADRLFTDLNKVTHRRADASVHLSDFPKWHESLIDKPLEERMELAQEISSMVLSLRKKVNIRVRQPLNKILLPVADDSFKSKVESVKDLILAEVNVKEIHYITDTAGILVKKIKPNFKVLGKKVGGLMKDAAAVIVTLKQADILKFESEGRFELKVKDQLLVLEPDDVEILSEDIPGWQVASDGKLTVALDITIDEKLKEEGIAREFINRIQNIRKDKGYEVTDKIELKVQNHTSITSSILNNKDYICAEILATSLDFTDMAPSEDAVPVEVDEDTITLIKIKKHE